MDPASIVAMTATAANAVRLLGQGVLSVIDMLHGIRDVDASTRGFSEELGAFQFTLTILDCEIRKGALTVFTGA